MKKFLVLYNAPREVMEEWSKDSKEDLKKGMDEWVKWGEAHKSDLVEFGTPLGRNTRITASGTTEVRNEVGGYSIVKAESKEEAAKIFSDNPHLKHPGTYIEIMELLDM